MYFTLEYKVQEYTRANTVKGPFILALVIHCLYILLIFLEIFHVDFKQGGMGITNLGAIEHWTCCRGIRKSSFLVDVFFEWPIRILSLSKNVSICLYLIGLSQKNTISGNKVILSSSHSILIE